MSKQPVTATLQDKEKQYTRLLDRIHPLLSGELDQIANLANIAAALKEEMKFHWVGFYIVKENELVLGPFQGPVACTRIQMGKGVCGTAWKEKNTLCISNVDDFPGHIACSAASRSEIVVPGFKHGKVSLLLDVDSDRLDDFDEIDQLYLERLMKIIEELN